MPTTPTDQQTSFLARFWSEQQRIAASLSDPSNQLLGTIAIIGGVASAVALGKLYVNLTVEEEQSPATIMARRGLTAMALGVGYVWWEMNKAQFSLAGESEMLAVATGEFVPSDGAEGAVDEAATT